MNEIENPKGHLLLRTLAMPADSNANGDIFGGWIMSQIDLAGGMLAKEISQGRVVTIHVSDILFKKPVEIGDVVCCYGECTKIGTSSMTIDLEVWVKPVTTEGVGKRYKVCEATFKYVAVNNLGRPREINKDKKH
ncbi:acyl-CoA esterase [Paraphotobacterium marinum]|uniref:Acyl-CoA esterase n=1 Tax=Paraphotobacterium marinum TaxID=1755811 RepID=A0A220VH71_9GAMM|nr:acyl-CoA thioester hydrolase YciA [Paraphotobacterium marinum]ASK79734.1 acyl-CoA esterase [Paraphotobacterium marinum]